MSGMPAFDGRRAAAGSAPGVWVPFAGNWPNVPIASWQISRYTRTLNTVTVRQVATLSGAVGATALIDMPFPAAFPVFTSVASLGQVKAIAPGVAWHEGWVYQTSVTPDRLVVVSRQTGTNSAADWGPSYPLTWAAGAQWGIEYTYEAVTA